MTVLLRTTAAVQRVLCAENGRAVSMACVHVDLCYRGPCILVYPVWHSHTIAALFLAYTLKHICVALPLLSPQLALCRLGARTTLPAHREWGVCCCLMGCLVHMQLCVLGMQGLSTYVVCMPAGCLPGFGDENSALLLCWPAV